ncbi:MAG: hypothetical protein PUE80_05680 [bacterium]|nr:hypothetical protein [bacterium]
MGCFAPHSHPSPPEEKAASRKKSRLRRKKNCAYGLQDRIMCSDAGRWGTAVVKPLVGAVRCSLLQKSAG